MPDDLFLDLELKIPPLPEQKRIVAILDKVDEIINKRKQSIKLLDELVKAKFVEMFGDPTINEKGWPVYALKELTTKIGSGATPKGGRAAYTNDGIPLIRSMNVYDGIFQKRGLAHLTASQAKLLKNVEVIKNDILMNITGASVTRSCLVPDELLPARVNQHVAIVRCKLERLNPFFLNSLFNSDSFKRLLLSKASQSGATRDALTKEMLESLPIPVPPLNMQAVYAEIHILIYNLISKINIYHKYEEELKSVLINKYFSP